MRTNPAAATHGLKTKSNEQHATHDEARRGQADAPGQVGVEIGAPDVLVELGILLGEASFDLFQDPLFVVAERHLGPSSWGERCRPSRL